LAQALIKREICLLKSQKTKQEEEEEEEEEEEIK
jgi:hypothetical protein